MGLMILGIAAAACASGMAIQQAWRCLRSRRNAGVSPWTWYLIIANAGLWIVWGIASHDYVAGVPSLATLPAASSVVARSQSGSHGVSSH